jgi:hypothetical protein
MMETDILDIAKAMLDASARVTILVVENIPRILAAFVVAIVLQWYIKFLCRVLFGFSSTSVAARRRRETELHRSIHRAVIEAKRSVGPPEGMSREAWIIQELNKIPDVIRQAEVEAERQWNQENGIVTDQETVGREHNCQICKSAVRRLNKDS